MTDDRLNLTVCACPVPNCTSSASQTGPDPDAPVVVNLISHLTHMLTALTATDDSNDTLSWPGTEFGDDVTDLGSTVSNLTLTTTKAIHCFDSTVLYISLLSVSASILFLCLMLFSLCMVILHHRHRLNSLLLKIAAKQTLPVSAPIFMQPLPAIPRPRPTTLSLSPTFVDEARLNDRLTEDHDYEEIGESSL